MTGWLQARQRLSYCVKRIESFWVLSTTLLVMQCKHTVKCNSSRALCHIGPWSMPARPAPQMDWLVGGNTLSSMPHSKLNMQGAPRRTRDWPFCFRFLKTGRKMYAFGCLRRSRCGSEGHRVKNAYPKACQCGLLISADTAACLFVAVCGETKYLALMPSMLDELRDILEARRCHYWQGRC